MEWISVKDCLPKSFKSVLIYAKSSPPVSAYLITDQENKPLMWVINDLHGNDNHLAFSEVSHWASFPNLPNEEVDLHFSVKR